VAKALEAQGKKLDSEAIRAALASDSARSIMTLYVTWPDPEEIKVIAQAGIDVLRGQSQVYFPQLGAGKAGIIPLDGIIVAPVAPPIATRLAPLFRALIGLIAGLALAFLAEYLDPTLRSRAEVEALGLAVIAEIPRH
jgi:capsular polysaccharide biosynthesis protein